MASRGVQRVVRSIPENAEYWTAARAANPRDPGALHLAVLGDSAAQAIGASTPDNGWVPLLAARLEARFGRPVAVWNLSVSGAVAQDVVDVQLPLLRDLPVVPDMVIVEIGGNDSSQMHRVTPESYLAAMREIMAAIPPGSFVTDAPWMGIPPWLGRSRLLARLIRPEIEAAGHHHLPLYEAARSKLDLGLRGHVRAMRTQMSEDFLHPSDTGYATWAEYFWRVIEESGWRPRDLP